MRSERGVAFSREMDEEFRVRWGLRGRENKAPIQSLQTPPFHLLMSLPYHRWVESLCPPEGYPGPEMDRTLKPRQTSRKP